MTLDQFLPPGSIITRAEAGDWRSAVEIAGNALVAWRNHACLLTAAMVETVEDLGPYIVIAPGFALAHARPSSSVLKNGISWVSLAEPVRFGNQANDPVNLVVGLAALDHDSHLDLMAALADVLSDESVLAAAIAAETPGKVREILASVVSEPEPLR